MDEGRILLVFRSLGNSVCIYLCKYATNEMTPSPHSLRPACTSWKRTILRFTIDTALY